MSDCEAPLSRALPWQLAWATVVGLVCGAGIALALSDTQSAERLRHAFLVCPKPSDDRAGA